MGYPKGKPRGPQTPEHTAKNRAALKKYHREHPGAAKEWENTPEEFALIQQYSSPLINRLRQIYAALDARCNEPDHQSYHNYGGRGIQNLFTSRLDFLNYVINELHITALEQIQGLTIDRIENNSHYMPGNIRFAFRKTQANNRRKGKG